MAEVSDANVNWSEPQSPGGECSGISVTEV